MLVFFFVLFCVGLRPRSVFHCLADVCFSVAIFGRCIDGIFITALSVFLRAAAHVHAADNAIFESLSRLTAAQDAFPMVRALVRFGNGGIVSSLRNMSA